MGSVENGNNTEKETPEQNEARVTGSDRGYLQTMSSSSPAGSVSRSPSPHTPAPEPPADPVAIQADLDAVAAWFVPNMPAWESDPALFALPRKADEEQMLRLDDLLEQHAFDECVSISTASAPLTAHPSASFPPQQQPQSQPQDPQHGQYVPSFRPTNLLVPSHNGPVSVTKPVPPPASLPRKLDAAAHSQRVVHPPRESCFKCVPVC